MGITNTLATLPGFIGPAVVGVLTYKNVRAESAFVDIFIIFTVNYNYASNLKPPHEDPLIALCRREVPESLGRANHRYHMSYLYIQCIRPNDVESSLHHNYVMHCER